MNQEVINALEGNDCAWMRHALALAGRAESEGEIPVGAVIVQDGELIAEGWNCNINLHDPSAHAEILALRAAGEKLGNHRLINCELFVTLEPCAMCVGACIHARIRRLIFGAPDPKTGALGGQCNLPMTAHYNHRMEIRSGVLVEESADLLRAFFRARR